MTHAMPPDTIANCGVVRAATTAASMSPRRGPLEERKGGDRQRGPGQHEDLVQQGDPGDLVADPVDDLTRPQPAIVAIATERRGIQKETPYPPAHRVRTATTGRYLSRSGPVSTAWAAASRATGTRNGEHET